MPAKTYIASAAAAVAYGCTDERNTTVHTVMPPDAIGEAKPEKRQRVLVVDEDKGHYKLLTKLLLKDFSNAVQVDCAYDAASALQLLMAVHSVTTTATSASTYDLFSSRAQTFQDNQLLNSLELYRPSPSRP